DLVDRLVAQRDVLLHLRAAEVVVVGRQRVRHVVLLGRGVVIGGLIGAALVAESQIGLASLLRAVVVALHLVLAVTLRARREAARGKRSLLLLLLRRDAAIIAVH